MKIAEGDEENKLSEPSAAAELGRKGGKARAAAMTPERLADIAKKPLRSGRVNSCFWPGIRN
ncbi:MAG TPA: hypothetical protein VFA50_02255 [Stellaceae bacterium]|nr:hypothetical protein [Stellaceae bacterium]